MPKNKAIIQICWGLALLLMGVAVFFRLPQVMPEIRKIEYFTSSIGFVKFCFYLLGVLLVFGGAKKLYANIKFLTEQDPTSPLD